MLPSKQLGFSFELKTTEKMPIANKKCLLPSIPNGDLFLNMALIYDCEGGNNFTTNISLTIEGDNAFLNLLDNWDFTGDFAVVSYLHEVKK